MLKNEVAIRAFAKLKSIGWKEMLVLRIIKCANKPTPTSAALKVVNFLSGFGFLNNNRLGVR